MQLQEPPVVVAGSVLNLVPVRDYDTKEQTGVKVRLIAGDGGVEVKLSNEQLAQVTPVPGDFVAWKVRYFPWQMEGRAGLACSLIEPVTPLDLDYLHGIASRSTEPVASK